jgi:hypothetical protein
MMGVWTLFTGLAAFPLTPTTEAGIDERAFTGLVTRMVAAGVDSVGALGSTGSYAYLSPEERQQVARLAVEAAGSTPVIVGIGALRTREVRRYAEDAQRAGAAAVLLAPMSYQALTPEEVYGLYETVTAELSVPLCPHRSAVSRRTPGKLLRLRWQHCTTSPDRPLPSGPLGDRRSAPPGGYAGFSRRVRSPRRIGSGRLRVGRAIGMHTRSECTVAVAADMLGHERGQRYHACFCGVVYPGTVALPE